MRLKGLDLNLLVALHALLDECSVSRAAERLHVTQPAASAALGRLRAYFGDELLVLHGKRMIPTSYAQSLMPEVSRVLTSINAMISMSAQFDPERSERVFRIVASDYIATVLLIPLAAELERLSPGTRLDVRLPNDAVRVEFDRGEVDLLLAPEPYTMPNHPAELVFEEPHVIAGWAENPIFDKPIGIDEFYNAQHIGVRLGLQREPTYTERHLDAVGGQRKMAIFAPNFSVVPWFLVGTRRLAVIQHRMAEAFKTLVPLRTAPLPFEFPPMRMMAQFHSARTSDQGLIWLMEHVKRFALALSEGDVGDTVFRAAR